MDVQVRGGKIDRELRRRQLARRLVLHQARTQTIFRFTGLSCHQLETLRERWGVTDEMRRRGPPPTSFAALRLRARDEAAALAVLWRVLAGARVPSVPALKMSALEFGERVCDVFDAYVACFPSSTLEIEHLLLVLRGLERGEVAFSTCRGCGAAVLVDALRTRHGAYFHCRRRVVVATLGRESSGSEEPISSSMHSGEPVQLKLF